MKPASLLLAAAILLAPAQARPRIGIINIQKALTSTADGKAAVAELERKFRPAMEKLAAQNSEIEKLRSQLQSGDSYESLKARIATLGQAYIRHQEDQRHEFDDAQQRVVRELSAKLMPVIEKYAKQKHLEVVLDTNDPKSSVVWIAAKHDITDEIIKLYDRSAKKP